MPKTIIKIKTWVCSGCEYHQDFPPTPELMQLNKLITDGNCPNCKTIPLTLETRPEKKITLTIKGEEDIEPEIEEMLKDEKKKKEMDTEVKKNTYRIKRQKDIAEAILKAKLLED